MITREQVADLQPGDVVELTDLSWGEGVTLRGPLRMNGDKLVLGYWTVRYGDGGASESHTATLTVVSRAPRPLYTNSDRTEFVTGDVVRVEWAGAGDDDYVNAYMPRNADDPEPWVSLGCRESGDVGERYTTEQCIPSGRQPNGTVRLLVDGETGQVVP